MSTNNPADDKSTVQRPTAPRIERGRFRRASIEAMDVEREGDRLYRVTHDGESYHADVENGGCTCPDAEYRGEKFVCKHAIRAALAEVFANTVSSELVARVVAFAREQGCPVDGHGGRCEGPLGRTGSLPCPTCCDAVRSPGVDEFDVWQLLVAPYRSQR